MTDYYSILERKIEAVRAEPVRSRALIYDLARYALKNKAYARDPTLTPAEINKQLLMLEMAIALVEAQAQLGDAPPKGKVREPAARVPPAKSVSAAEFSRPSREPDYEVVRESPIRPRGGRDLVVLPPRNVDHSRFADEDFDSDEAVMLNRRMAVAPETMAIIQLLAEAQKSRSSRALRLLDGLFRAAVVVAIVGGGYAVWSGQIGNFLPTPSVPGPVAAVTEPVATVATPTAPEPKAVLPSTPRPTVYGVYAVHDDRLVTLERANTIPVDPRAKHLLQISEPSHTVFEDGRLSFSVYRRDLATSAPIAVPIRIVARIASVMRFGPGGTLVNVKPEKDTWLIYSAGYNFRVLPVPDNQEMILIQPDDPNLVLPPGRYALVLDDQHFEFRVAGEVTDPRSCVEGVATPQGPVFHVCKPEAKS